MNFIEIVNASEVEETHGVVEAQNVSDEGLLASMGINGTLFVFQLLNFAIVFCILWFLILKPLSKKLAERQKMIAESVENSEKIQELLRKSEQAYQERIDNAKKAVNIILERAGEDAELIAKEMKEKARREIEAVVENTKKSLKKDKEEMTEQLRKETADLVIAALEKILPEKINAASDKKIIEEALNKIRYEKNNE